MRNLDSELSTAGYLRVAKGYTPDSARHIELFPLNRITLPPEGSRDYDSQDVVLLHQDGDGERREDLEGGDDHAQRVDDPLRRDRVVGQERWFVCL